MSMSTISGFVLGAIAAVGLTILFGDKLHHSLGETAAEYSVDLPEALDIAQADKDLPTGPLPTTILQGEAQSVPAAIDAAATSSTDVMGDSQINLEHRWAEFAAQADSLVPVGEFPWRSCFARAAATYELPETLLLAIASGESNFDPAARSDKDAVGLMQILWPGTSRHLGVLREADLYDPCTNVDAGARYLQELARRFDNNLHLMVAAYNYGPGRIVPGAIPQGARWYSEYIYQHLQQVLGGKQAVKKPEIAGTAGARTGRQLVMSFSGPARARDFMTFLNVQIPELSLQLQNDVFGQHDVVLLYTSESERQSALSAISAAGVVPVTAKLYL
jgi:hypothetical protein